MILILLAFLTTYGATYALNGCFGIEMAKAAKIVTFITAFFWTAILFDYLYGSNYVSTTICWPFLVTFAL